MSLLRVAPANKWLLVGPAAGLALLFTLSYLYLLPTPPAPTLAPTLVAPDTLAAADSTAPPPSPPEPPFFAPGSPGIQIAQLIARQNYREARQQLGKLQEGTAREEQGLSFQRAYCDQAMGDHQAALTALGRLGQAHPDLEDYRLFWLARSLEETGAAPEAMAQYEALLANGRQPVLVEEARLRLAELCLKQNQGPRALELLAAAAAGPRAPEALARLARVAPDPAARQHRLRLWRQFPAHALALEAATQATAPLSPEENGARALVYFSHKHYSQASQLLKGLLAAKPKPPFSLEIRFLLGQVRGAEGQWEEARGIYAKLWSKDQYPAALYQLALALARLDRDREALDHFRLFAERFPQDNLAHEALWQAGRIAERSDEFALADQYYSRLAEQYPASTYRDEARWRGGFMAYCRNEDARALEIFAALGSQASDAQLADQGLFWAGKAAQRLGRAEEAKGFFQQTADHFPRSYYATRAASMGYRPAPAAPDSSTQPQPLHTRRARALLELGFLDLAQAELPDSGRLVPAELAALKAIRNTCEGLELRGRSLRLSSRIVAHDYSPEELPHAYPRYFFDRVQTAAREAQVDPCLVISVIRQESFFDSGAVSPVGALGLMQIMPQTGQQLARQLGVTPFSRERLLEAQVSIRMGSHYLAEQVRAFQAGPAPELGVELGLAAYNAGPEAARRWLQRYPHSDPDLFVERIPYKETRLYVKKVMRNFAIYKSLTQV
ncbi:MAG: transglycosylase SLT domain-containing protein [Candidatus Latescibacteria bacterium]|nr:transglycosylase SLT domain-containing protein [Candidatus Latescibacterota bacterium]